jgi:tetratricopeptide (TPR) repeat protein
MDRSKLPGDLVERAFKLKWESELLQDNFTAATATCLAFNRLYPESILADQALMTLGRTLAQKGQYQEAVDVYARVLQLQNPISAAEAQFRIGETLQNRPRQPPRRQMKPTASGARAGSLQRPRCRTGWAEPSQPTGRPLKPIRRVPLRLRRWGVWCVIMSIPRICPGFRTARECLFELSRRSLSGRDADALGQGGLQDG